MPLSDVARMESGHTPSRRHPEYWGGSIPWIGISDATENYGQTLMDTYQHVTEAGIANSSARVLPANTVCLSRTASVGYVVVMGVPMATSQDFVNWVCGDGIDHRFLKYVLIGERSSMLRFASGTTHQTIYFPEAKAFHVCLPPIEEQRAIASLLGALDDKIDLNRRMNDTLEAMARAIFKSWFVDFDPVRAKAGGEQPWGMDTATAALFPDVFEDSDLGEIPQGWRVGTLADVANITMGQSPPGDTYNEVGDGLPFYQGTRDFGWRFPSRRVYCTTPTRLAAADDVLVSVRAPVGSLNLATDECGIGRGVAGVRSKLSPSGFLYYSLDASRSGWEVFEASGTVFGSASKADVNGFKLLLPNESLIRRFGEVVASFDQRMLSNHRESATLAELRDTLLPKLLSGEVRVGAAEKMVEAAS